MNIYDQYIKQEFIKLTLTAATFFVCALSYAASTPNTATPDHRQVGAGYLHACAIDDSVVRCWGNNDYGQTIVPALTNPTQIGGGERHACALDSTGMHCWGSNYYGETVVPALVNPTQMSVAPYHTCALDSAGVHCWGLNNNGQIDVPILTAPTQVSGGLYHSCAIDSTGVHCWGAGTTSMSRYTSFNTKSGQEFGQSVAPVLSNPKQIEAGGWHTCAIDDNGLHCWGAGTTSITARSGIEGSDGTGFEYGQSVVPTLMHPRQVTAGLYHTCALDDNGVHCWGANGFGQTNVPTLVNPIQVNAGNYYTCAVDDNGVQCWGANDHGQTSVPSAIGQRKRLAI